MGNESLLTAKEEKKISATIKICNERVEELLDRVGFSAKSKGDQNRTKNIESKRIGRLYAIIRAYSEKAKELKTKFVKGNLKLVVKIARNYRGKRLPYSDVIQEGNLGLIKAVDKFDHTKGYRFATYAYYWIRQSMSRALMEQTNTVKIPVYLIENTNKIWEISSMLQEKLGRKPLPEEVSEEAQMSSKSVKYILEGMSSVVSLDTHAYSSGGKDSHSIQATFLEFITDEDLSKQDSIVEEMEVKRIIKEYLFPLLTSREETVIRMRFGIDQGSNSTLGEIGDIFDLTRERIRQIQNKALQKLTKSEVAETLRSSLEFDENN